jgi:zinc protease
MKFTLRLVTLSLHILSLWCSLVFNQAHAQISQSSTILPIDRLVSEGRLDNGMRFFFRPTETAGVDIRLVVNVGSLDETDNEMGYAHFVEHLAFRKTARFRDGEIVDFVRSLGGSFGQHLNAFTSHNQTQYWITLPAGKIDALPKAIQVLKDWATGIDFSDDLINIERGVVASEKRSRDQSTQPIFKIRGALYDQGLYRREIVGTYDTIGKASAASLGAFYKRTYTPEKMSIVVSGQLPDGANFWKRRLNDEFGSQQATVASAPVRPAFTFENRVRVMQLTDGQRSSVSLVSLFPQSIGTDRASFANWVLRSVATTALNQRLNEAAKLQSWTLGQAAADFPLANDARGFELAVVVKDKSKFLDGYELLRGVLEKFLTEGPTAEELEAVSQPMLRAARTFEEESVRQSPSAVGANLAMYAHAGGYYLSSSQYRELLEQEITKISPNAAVKSIAERYQNLDLLVIIQGERNDPTPKLDEKELFALTKTFTSNLQAVAKASQAKSEVLGSPKLPVFNLPAPLPAGSILKEDSLANDVTRLTLSNNAVVYVKPIQSATVDQVVFSAKTRQGIWIMSQDQLPTARVAQSGGWITAGIGPYTQTALARELSAKNIDLRLTIDNTYTGYSIQSRSEYLPFALHLLHQFVREPKFNDQNLDRLITGIRPGLTEQNLPPEQQFTVKWRQSRYGENPWLDSLTPAQLDSTNAAQLKKLHEQVFGDTSQFVFAFSGNVSLRDIRRLCETYLANLPSSQSKEIAPAKWPYFAPEKTGIRTEVKVGKAERASLSVRYANQKMRDSLELGGTSGQIQSVLSNRLRLALRQDTGLTYSPNTSVQIFAAPVEGIYINIDVTIAATDVAKVEAIIRKTVQSLTEQAPTAEELEAYRESYSAATKNLFLDPSRVADLLLSLHTRNVSTEELIKTRQAMLTRDAQTLMTNFKNVLAGIEPSIGIHLPE